MSRSVPTTCGMFTSELVQLPPEPDEGQPAIVVMLPVALRYTKILPDTLDAMSANSFGGFGVATRQYSKLCAPPPKPFPYDFLATCNFRAAI